jgi:hypothetical protein
MERWGGAQASSDGDDQGRDVVQLVGSLPARGIHQQLADASRMEAPSVVDLIDDDAPGRAYLWAACVGAPVGAWIGYRATDGTPSAALV